VIPSKIEKIRAMAQDTRGDPATRAIAQQILERYQEQEPVKTPPRNQRHPGLRPTFEHQRYRFMDLEQWKVTANGNRTILVGPYGPSYRVTLFKHKKTPTYGWLVLDVLTEETIFSKSKYATLGEAHRGSWDHLMSMSLTMVSP
jgi:hypothetical protein